MEMGQNSDHVLTQIIRRFSSPASHNICTVNITPIGAPGRSPIEFMASAHHTEPAVATSIQHCNPQVNKIMSNTLYLTFNAPRVDDYVYSSATSLIPYIH
jgi:hypothetical protein